MGATFSVAVHAERGCFVVESRVCRSVIDDANGVAVRERQQLFRDGGTQGILFRAQSGGRLAPVLQLVFAWVQTEHPVQSR